jgi:hypothetical protein
MNKVFIIIGFIIAAIFIFIGFFNTIIELIGSLAVYLIWIVYFLAIGIVYEIIVRSYRLFIKFKNARRR